jgi:hypothetical protein
MEHKFIDGVRDSLKARLACCPTAKIGSALGESPFTVVSRY